jgi:hypothetical protein
MSETQWKQFVQLFSEKNPHLSKQQVLKEAKKPFQQLKQYYQKQTAGNVFQNNLYDKGDSVIIMFDNGKEVGRGTVLDYNQYPTGLYYTIKYVDYNNYNVVKTDRFMEKYVYDDDTNYGASGLLDWAAVSAAAAASASICRKPKDDNEWFYCYLKQVHQLHLQFLDLEIATYNSRHS